MYIKTMFDLKKNEIKSRELYKADFYRYSPTSLATIKNWNSYSDINIPRDNISISLQKSYTLVESEVTKNVNAIAQYANENEYCLVNLGAIALFPKAKLSKSSNKHLEKFEKLHTVSLMHKL